MPRPGPLYAIWRRSHLSEADAVEFFNDFWQWQSGQPLRPRNIAPSCRKVNFLGRDFLLADLRMEPNTPTDGRVIRL